MQQSKVKIMPDDFGNVIRVSNKDSKYGHVRVSQTRLLFSDSGWVNKKPVSALIHGTVEDLKDMGIENLTELDGKIVIQEQLEPFNAKEPDRDYKIAGSTGIICCSYGQPIYRKTFYKADPNAEDVFVAHTNGDDIKISNGQKTMSVLNQLIFNTKDDKEIHNNVKDEVIDNTEEIIEVSEEIEGFSL